MKLGNILSSEFEYSEIVSHSLKYILKSVYTNYLVGWYPETVWNYSDGVHGIFRLANLHLTFLWLWEEQVLRYFTSVPTINVEARALHPL